MAGGVVSRSHGIAALVLGIIELVVAIAIAILSFVLAGKFDAPVSHTPYWAGLPYMVPGILGIVVGVTKNKCAMISFMVVNIICCVINTIACIVLTRAVASWNTVANAASAGSCIYFDHKCECPGTFEYVSGTLVTGVDSCEVVKTIYVLILIIVAFMTINCIVSLSASIVACLSCGQSNQQEPLIVQHPVIIQGAFAQPEQGYIGPGAVYGQQPPSSYPLEVKQLQQ